MTTQSHPGAEGETTSVLIGFDGSEDAKRAIGLVARLMPGVRCTILTVWQPFIDVLVHSAGGFGILSEAEDAQKIDDLAEAAARRTADEGVKLAREGGLDAVARSAVHSEGAADAILDEARTLDATAIVLGSRGLSGIKSILLGSVSHGVLHRADRPVLVVPSDAVVASRDAHRHATDRADAQANQG
jgi:nucleotide-binding universal stress UspA family protein